MYVSDEERAERLSVWVDNLAFIESYNTRTTSHWVRPCVAPLRVARAWHP